MSRTACLKLILPRSLEEQIVDHLLQHPEWVSGFTTCAVDGHGSPHRAASNVEQVRGRAGRLQIEILIVEGHVRELVDHLKAELPNTDITWWMTPVLASGDFR